MPKSTSIVEGTDSAEGQGSPAVRGPGSKAGRPSQQEVPDPFWLCVLIAGIGGTLPTLTRLATSLIGSTTADLPTTGFWAGVAIYFIVGAVMCCATKERALRNALFAGIAAPALLLSGTYGTDRDAKRTPRDSNAPAAVPLPQKEKIEKTSVDLLDLLVKRAVAAEKRVFAEDAPPRASRECLIHDDDLKEQGTIYAYQVEFIRTGAPNWSIEDSPNPWTLDMTCQRGSIAWGIMHLDNSLVFRSRSPVTKIQLENRKDFIPSTNLPANTGGTIQISLVMETKKGFFWALGGQGHTRIASYEAKFIPSKAAN